MNKIITQPSVLIDIIVFLCHKVRHVLKSLFYRTKLPERSPKWHKFCLEITCQELAFFNKLLNLIPRGIPRCHSTNPTDFTRDRKLSFPKLVTFILSITASGKSQGIQGKARDLFKSAGRSNLWLEADSVHRSAFTRARKKVHWEFFQGLLRKVVDVAYDLWPENTKYLWSGMSVFAVDGSMYSLPATPELREEFDPESGIQNPGKGHYPQCLVSTLYDVFRRLPVARTVTTIHGSERQEAKKLLPFIPSNSVLLLDRGYPGYEFIKELVDNFTGFFVCRCPSESTFPAVESFVKSGKQESIIWIDPSNKYRRTIGLKKGAAIKLRVIKLRHSDGTISVLLTNLFDRNKFTKDQITDLYFRRWEIESYYRDEKVILEVTKFHSKTANGIRQELLAMMIMSVISRTLMALSSSRFETKSEEYQFKNAMMTLASDAAVLTPENPEKAIEIFTYIIRQIVHVKYYRPKKPRKPQPRVTKKAINKWCVGRRKKLAYA
jgi:hypothetical protein